MKIDQSGRMRQCSLIVGASGNGCAEDTEYSFADGGAVGCLVCESYRSACVYRNPSARTIYWIAAERSIRERSKCSDAGYRNRITNHQTDRAGGVSGKNSTAKCDRRRRIRKSRDKGQFSGAVL